MPYLGVHLKHSERDFYNNAFGFYVPESKEITGNGYGGYLFSAGDLTHQKQHPDP